MINTKLVPVLTEKSLDQAKKGFYTFYVDPSMNKYSIKFLIEKTFEVHVTSVKTMNYKKEIKKNMKGKKQVKKAKKKTMVTLKEKEKIDIFEEKGK